MEWNGQTIALTLLTLCCVLPLVGVAALGLRAFNWLSRLTTLDESDLRASYERWVKEHPQATREQLIAKIIRQQALRCGVIGALTGLGGFFTLPIALPIDIYTTLRLQTAMIAFIAYSYGKTQTPPTEARVRTALIVYGTGKIAERGGALGIQLVFRIMGKTLTKLVPIVGALISFAANYIMTYAVGWTAARWYGHAEKRP